VQPQFTYRHYWQPHDIVMWDNRCTLHMAVPDNDHSQPRVMYRTTVSGTPSGRILNEGQDIAAA
jgi:taurine dioxygenase